jgi:bifunctional aromatase (cyclase/dehydratase)
LSGGRHRLDAHHRPDVVKEGGPMYAQPLAPGVPTELYLEIQRFYARHMHAGDGGDMDAWAAGFAPDAVFVSNGLPDPLVGRDAIDAASRAGAAGRAARGVVHRHVMTMLDVVEAGSGAGRQGAEWVRTRSYVLVVEIRQGGGASLHVSTVCEDLLVAHEGGWLVRERRVTRDDLPVPAAR